MTEEVEFEGHGCVCTLFRLFDDSGLLESVAAVGVAQPS